MSTNETTTTAQSTSHALLNAALYERTQILVQDEGIRRLQRANIFLAGCGGVGGHCAEALVRAGVGKITLCDHDVVSSTNKNRQLIALDSTIGKSKVFELSKRLTDISALCQVTVLDAFLLPEDMEDILSRQTYDVVADCIDSVECKISLLAAAIKLGLKVYSSCGAGGRLDPSLVKLGDLFDTENDGLARVCRNELRKLGIGPGLITVVHSSEIPKPPLEPQRQDSGGRDRSINGTISYMPPLFGLWIASGILRALVDPETAERDAKRRRKETEKKESLRQKQSTHGFQKAVERRGAEHREDEGTAVTLEVGDEVAASEPATAVSAD